MKVLCIYWKGTTFQPGEVYNLDSDGLVISEFSKTMFRWNSYRSDEAIFVPATDLIKALA